MVSAFAAGAKEKVKAKIAIRLTSVRFISSPFSTICLWLEEYSFRRNF
jgi:hypothetical protein